jgi:hypothetical protein
MPNSVVVGRLRAVEGDSIILGGGVRIHLPPGVSAPKVPLGTSLTVVTISRDEALFAQSIRLTPEQELFGPVLAKPPQ